MTAAKVEDLTKYPKIYRNVYWGNFPATDDLAGHPDTINNRNKFVEEFGIIGPLRAKADIFDGYCVRLETSEVDHPEYYRTKTGGVVVVCSNYNLEPPKELGLKPYLQIYGPTARTYIKCWDSVAAYRAEVLARKHARLKDRSLEVAQS